MRILWFSPVEIKENLRGSGGWVNSLSIELLKKSNVELHIAFKSNQNELVSFKKDNLTLWHIPSDIFSKAKVRISNLTGYKIDSKIDLFYSVIVNKSKPDIIQVFGTESDFGNVLLHTTIPVVFHIQAVYQVYHHKYFAGITEKEVRKFSPWRSKLLFRTFISIHKKRDADVLRENQFFKKGKYFLGRTDWDRRCVMILSPISNYFHCDEVMRDVFYCSRWNKEYDGETINLVSIIGGAIYKGLETIIQTLEILNKSTEYKIRWNVIGINDKTESVMICKNMFRFGLSKNLYLRDRLSAEEVKEVILNSDMFVHPSHIENSPNSVCEAMLLGIPIVSTYTGGTSSLVTENETGILIQDGDPWSMAGAIKELYENYSKAKKMGDAAHLVAMKRHEPSTIANELLLIYEKILTKDTK